MKNMLAIFALTAALVFGLFTEPVQAQSNWTFTAGGTIAANDRVYLSSSNTVITAGATNEGIGIAVAASTSTNSVEVILYAQNDIALFKADGAITAGADVYPGATGYVSATVSAKRIGKAITTTTTAGDIVKVLVLGTQIDRVFVTAYIAAATVDEWVFVADKAYTVVSCKCVYSVAGGSSAACRPRKVTAAGTDAPGGAASATCKELTTAAFDLTATANVSQTLTLSATASDYTLAAGDKIGLDMSGTLTALAGGVVVIELKAN